MIKINFYGIVFALSIVACFFVLRNYFKKKNRNKDLAFVSTLYLTLGLLIGARIFYVLYYNFAYFVDYPFEIFYIWQGGLSFHGGLLGILLACYIFCKQYKVDFLEMADSATIPLSFFLALGKIANFFNSELYGKITNVSWCVKFKDIEGCRHPVQIYEAVKNFFIFALLVYFKMSKQVKKGIILFSFIFLYSFLRFFIDFFREYEAVYFGLGSGQYLNIATFLVSGYFLFKFLREDKP